MSAKNVSFFWTAQVIYFHVFFYPGVPAKVVFAGPVGEPVVVFAGEHKVLGTYNVIYPYVMRPYSTNLLTNLLCIIFLCEYVMSQSIP